MEMQEDTKETKCPRCGSTNAQRVEFAGIGYYGFGIYNLQCRECGEAFQKQNPKDRCS